MELIERILDSKWYARKKPRSKIKIERFLTACLTTKELISESFSIIFNKE